MKAPVKYGLYFFAVSALITLVQYFINKEILFNTTLSLVISFGLAILFIILAIREDRDSESGYSFAEGIKAAMICYGLGTLLGMVFSYIFFNFVDPSLIDAAIEYSKEIAEKTATTMADFMGADEAQKADMMAELEKQEITNPFTLTKLLLSWVLGLVFPGLIISLIAAAIMKRN